jgi:hypothetical protein
VLRTVFYLIAGLVFAVPGVVLLYGSIPRDPRWPSRSHRVAVILTGLAMFALGAAFVTAAWTSERMSKALLIAGGLAAVACAIARWLVRYRWERSDARSP